MPAMIENQGNNKRPQFFLVFYSQELRRLANNIQNNVIKKMQILNEDEIEASRICLGAQKGGSPPEKDY